MSQQAIQAKEVQVQSITSDLQKAKSFIVFEYSGLTAKSITALRSELYKSGSKMYVLKNNILRRALKEAGINDFEGLVKGPNAIAIAFEDEIAPIKNVNNVAKEFDVVNLKGAYIENTFADQNKIQQLANIPGREGLYSMFLSCLQSPIRSFLYAVKAVSETKSE
ncbi:50S ribosomal protein L10 [Ureaplasma ceti]|uniref:Large ribosomal subunit protein uL10 n=1 Tax=Ureaplasma ceti TaxID=3119530 RepID=A0ABP9UBN2_9BACT